MAIALLGGRLSGAINQLRQGALHVQLRGGPQSWPCRSFAGFNSPFINEKGECTFLLEDIFSSTDSASHGQSPVKAADGLVA